MRLNIIFLIISIHSTSIAQFTQKLGVLDREVDPSGILEELPLPTPSTKGSTYLQEDWCDGKLILTGGKMIDKPVLLKYNLMGNVLEIKHNGIVRICPIRMLDKFYIKNNDDERTFINGSLLKSSTKFKNKLIQLLYSKEDFHLIQSYKLEVRKSDYRPEIDVGNRSHKYIIKKRRYLYSNNFLLPVNNKKELLVAFPNQRKSIIHFIKKNKLKIKNKEDIITAINFIVETKSVNK